MFIPFLAVTWAITMSRLSAHRGAVTGRSAAGRRAHAGHGLARTCAGAHQAADAWFFQKNGGSSRPRKISKDGNFGISMGISLEVGMILGECEDFLTHGCWKIDGMEVNGSYSWDFMGTME